MVDDPAWTNLIFWLRSKGMDENILVCSKFVPGAGRGLFTTKDVPPSTPLFTIPRSAHMNLETLRPLYKSIGAIETLTASQMISMHIFLHRPSFENTKSSPGPTFGTYISILPQDFEGHPLSWMICPQKNANLVQLLLSFLPPGIITTLKTMAQRFWADWRTVSEILKEHPDVAASTRTYRPLETSLSPLVTELHIPQFCWAWLNVNTRCVYSRISGSSSDSDNITLCPVLDLANHRSASTYAPSVNPIPTFFSPPSHPLREGQEVYLRYGSHSNATLFTEYGFIEEHPENGGQADVEDVIERRFQEKGPLGEWMKQLLMEVDYWGDWKLYEYPPPAHPSYRLFPALRLLQLSLPSLSNVEGTFGDTAELLIWRETLMGRAEIVSKDNEKLVWETLAEICKVSALRAEEQHRSLEKEVQAYELTGWMGYATRAVSSLWLEEKRVCQAVQMSLVNGDLIN